MFNNRKILCFIPARIGSQRVPKKNIKLLGDKPLFMYSVELAKNCEYIDGIFVSTDSQEIKDLSVSHGCINSPLRPKKLSNNNARIIDAILYEITANDLDYDDVILLQPTYPFRSLEMLNGTIEKYYECGAKSLITVTKVKENPIFFRTIINNELIKLLEKTSDVRSQDFEDFYRIVGSIYINNIKLLTPDVVLNENRTPYIINEDYCLDIDTIEDFEAAQSKIGRK